MKDLVDTTEMYLRTIFELEEEGIPPLRARIAERLDQSGPTVSQTVSRMERDGLLHIAPDRSLKLTKKGRDLAVAVMRKHRLAERLLTDVIGMSWEVAHDEACRWEHVMGTDVERRLTEILPNYYTSPFGNPIPGLDAIIENAPRRRYDTSIRASDLDFTSPTYVELVSINEIVQVEHKIISKFSKFDVTPGRIVSFTLIEAGLLLQVEEGEIVIPHELCHAIRVRELEDEELERLNK